MTQPGKLAGDGQRWVYHSDGHRKCWFQTAVGASKRPVHHFVAKQRATSRENKEAVLPKRNADADAHAEVLPSAPAEMSQPTPPSAPDPKVANAAIVPTVGVAAIEQSAPVGESAPDQLTSDRPTQRLAETLGVSPSSNDTIDSPVLSATPVALRVDDANDDQPDWTATWLGALLMALGLASVLSAGLPTLFGLLSARS